MFYQNKPGVYVYTYFRHALDKKLEYHYFPNLTSLFWNYSEWQITLFRDITWIYRSITSDDIVRFSSIRALPYYSAAYDENGVYLSPDRLVGLYRQWRRERLSGRSWTSDCGRRPQAYGGYRTIKTTQERRMAFDDPESIELGITIHRRCARNAVNLPNAWDDIKSHSDKSWKTQSKRRSQWRSG